MLNSSVHSEQVIFIARRAKLVAEQARYNPRYCRIAREWLERALLWAVWKRSAYLVDIVSQAQESILAAR